MLLLEGYETAYKKVDWETDQKFENLVLLLETLMVN